VNPIQQVNLHAQGAVVAILHAALLFLIRNQDGISDKDRATLEGGLAAELRGQTFGDWTAHLVSHWQEQLAVRFHLVVSGNVDQATADALNMLLAELGAPGMGGPGKPASIVIRAPILWFAPNSAPLPVGTLVRIWPNGNADGAPQEFAVDRDGAINGKLKIPGDKLDPKKGARLCFIRAFNPKDQQIAAAREAIAWHDGTISDAISLGRLVSGRVLQDGKPIAPTPERGVEVVRAGDTVARGQSDGVAEDGTFWVKYQPFLDEKTQPSIELRYGYDRAHAASLASRVIANPGVEERADLVVDTAGARPVFVIRGPVGYASRNGLGAAFELRVIQQRLGGDETLYTASVGAADTYQIEFPTPKHPGALRVEVHIADKNRRMRTLLFASPPVARPVSPLELPLLVGDPADTLPLFEGLLARITPHLDGLRFAALDATQWTTLSEASGVTQGVQRRFRQAVTLTANLTRALDKERAGAQFLPVFFVLASEGTTITLAELAAQPDDDQLARVARAIAAGDIGPEPWRLADGPDAYTVTFGDFLKLKKGALADRVLFDTGSENTNRAAQIAAVSVTDAAKRYHIMSLWQQAGTAPGAFEQQVAASTVLDGGEKQHVLTVHGTSSLVEGQMSLVAALTDADAKRALANPASLAVYSTDELATVIQASGGAPVTYSAAPDPARAFADAIIERTHAQFPTGAFVARLSADASAAAGAKQAAAVLEAHPAFNLFATPVAANFTIADGKPRGEDARVALPTGQYEALQKTQRLARLAPVRERSEAVSALMKMGLDSAHAITSMGQMRFRDAASKYFSSDVANTVYSTSVRTKNFTAIAYRDFSTISGWAYPGYFGIFDPKTGTRDQVPDLNNLFGSFDSCACEQCRSVYSPAAYLADLLHWLDKEFYQPGTGLSGYAKLMERRGDVAKLELSCENSETLLEHIDLVLEILEYIVAQGQVNDLSALDHQTKWQTPDLLRDGEYFGVTERSAYTAGRLIFDVYPWSLPFNLWLAQARAYLGQMGASRADLVELATNLKPWDSDADLAAEMLGLDQAQFRIISGQSPFNTLAHWNNVDITASSVSAILLLSGLSYEALLDILKTEYVRHAGSAPVKFEIVFDAADQCDLDKATIRPGLGTIYAERIHRIARLQRALQWTYWEIDESIIALSDPAHAPDLDQDFLIRLGHFELIRRRTKLPIAELLTWFGQLPAYKGEIASDFYKAAFLEKSGPGNSASIFALAVANDVPDRKLAVDRPLVSTATNALNAADVQLLRETLGYTPAEFAIVTGFGFGPAPLSLPNLSVFYRFKSLCTTTGLTIGDIVEVLLFATLGSGWTPGRALAVLDYVDWLKAAGLSQRQLHYLLLGTGDGDGLGLAADHLTQLKGKLYGANGKFHAILSDPPTPVPPSASSQNLPPEPDRVDRLFKRFLDSVQPPEISALFGAVVRKATNEFPATMPNSTTPFDAGAFMDATFAPSPMFPVLDVGAAVTHAKYPRPPDVPADPNDQHWRSELEVKTIIGLRRAPIFLAADLQAATLDAYSEFFDLPPAIVKHFLEHAESSLLGTGSTFLSALTPATALDYDPGVPIEAPANFDALISDLYLVVARFRRLGLTGETLAGLEAYRPNPNPGVAATATALAWFNPYKATGNTSILADAVRAWRNLTEGLALRSTLAVSLETLVNTLVQAAASAMPLVQARTFITGAGSTLVQYNAAEIDAVLNHLQGFGYGDSIAHIVAKAATTLANLSRWKLTLAQAVRFSAYPINGTLPDDIRASLRSRFTEIADWDKAIRSIHNPLREVRRDRLVDWLIPRSGVKDVNGLYEHFLVDVEMSSCMKTSRLVLATNAVQLFIQRIFLNLEQGFAISAEMQAEWQWRRNYRVWEAARKVFLYPENWLEESLRLRKSPFFAALEEELQQGELSSDRIEQAFVNYLEKTAEVARLDIRGLCFDSATTSGYVRGQDLHVFGRTRSQPHRYYHRERVSGAWSPWSAIEQEIEGDHLIPVVWNRRLHVFWPTFVPRKAGGDDYLEIYVNDISLQSGKWSRKRKSTTKVLSAKYSGVGVFDALEFKTGPYNALHAAGSLTLSGDFDSPAIVGYRYVGPLSDSGPGWSWSLAYPPEVTSLDQRFNIFPASFGTPSAVADVGNWKPKYGQLTIYDFSCASLDPKDYFFRAHPDGADLRIRARRGFCADWETWHCGYLEAAYEDGFRFAGGDPAVTVEPDYAPHASNDLAWSGKFLNCRPYYTLPAAMKLHNGFDTVSEAAQQPQAASKLYSKAQIVHYEATPQQRPVLFDTTPTAYELAFPQQNEHQLFGTPFFFEDKSHTYFADFTLNSLTLNLGFGSVIHLVFPQYSFVNFHIPGIRLYLAEVNSKGVDGVFRPQPASSGIGLLRQQQVFDAASDFQSRYAPTALVSTAYPAEDIDFIYGSPTAPYFWEIHFHIPMLMAERLRAEGKFADALRWIGCIFDPTIPEDSGNPLGAKRCWLLKPFFDYVSQGPIQQMMRALSIASTPAEVALRNELTAQIQIWEHDPFDPHGVAAIRPLAYMLWTFMRYVEILIDWGDSLFRQDSRESINEAMQLYVLADQLLGRKPVQVTKQDAAPKTFAEIRTLLDAFSNVAVGIENNLTVYDVAPTSSTTGATQAAQALYFCVPDNPQFLALYDTVADRKFKIEHCMNIDGTVRDLALLSAPIDPGLLVRARAAGLDIASVLADLAAPRPNYRFSYLLQKANEFTAEVKSFGAALLSAMEKRDGEQLAQLRSQHEIALQNAMRNVRQRQLDEAKLQVAALQLSRTTVEVRKADYEARQYFLPAEIAQMELLVASQVLNTGQAIGSGIAAILHAFDLQVGIAAAKIIRLGNIAQALATASGALAGVASLASSLSGQVAGAQRRKEEWDLQLKLAAAELNQIDKQIAAAEIRAAIAEQELANIELQIDQSKEVLDFMKSKFTNDALYSWMAGRLATLHYQAYKLAYGLAKKAQMAYAFELGLDDNFVQFGSWDGQKQGLLAGETLSLQLRQLESAYIDNNKREYELRRNISLRLLDPAAIVALIHAGSCEFELPEWLFDIDCAGLYMRRIRLITVTVPCVTGPQIPVHCRLTLLRHEIRQKANYTDARDVHYDAIQSIITSTALNDSGLFEPSMQDQRYLPFEGCGAVSRFRLELMNPSQFDTTTISDVILGLSYTARDGGDGFRAAGASTLQQLAAPPKLLMSYRQDFQDDWAALIAQGTAAAGTTGSAPIPLNGPVIPLDRKPYRARVAQVQYQYAKRAWALIALNNSQVMKDGRFDIVEITPDTLPVQGGTTAPASPDAYFGVNGLVWTGKPKPTSVVGTFAVIDLFLLYK
jgi:hypothetical protein